MTIAHRPRGLLSIGHGRGRDPLRKPAAGTYAEAWYDEEEGAWRVCLSDAGRAALADWIGKHPHPVCLVREWWPHLYATCRSVRMTDEEIDDAAVEGVVLGFLRYDPERGTQLATSVSWSVRGSVSHALRVRIRSARVQPRSDLFAREPGHGEPMLQPAARPEADAAEGLDSIRGLLAKTPLTPRQRSVVELLYGEGLTHAAAGARLGGVTRQSIEAIRGAALKRLRRAAAREGAA